ncbi:MAG TPA: acyltransferase [Sphingomonas sp.]|uniref:acyltransferase family protein n=1 Tax=Sphingomonas sp. TaxID=28214 RepID=UPI002C33302A|nr:acyltransferase [Sphingomonas sp.]HMI18747.1 acyltransferase [Sphingomonas sp.]
MITVEQRAIGRDNNFNLLRMIAATVVLVSHAWPLTMGMHAIEPLYTLTGYKLGTTAVSVFFAISGFFITKSFANRASIGDFVLARVARIYPGLIAVLLLTMLVLGPIFTTLPLGVYFSDIHTWAYVPVNLTLKKMMWGLPGVFAGNPYGHAINGSLWTLYWEVCCYGLVVVAGLIGLSRPAFMPLILAVAIGATFLVPQAEAGSLLRSAATLSLPFAIGAAVYVYRRWVPVSGLLVLLLFGLAAFAFGTILYPMMHAFAVAYAALWLGFADIPGIKAYNRFGDFSYGMYIYAFPVEQAMMALFHDMKSWPLILASFPLTLLLAIASWTWIESPALNHRHILVARLRLRRKRQDSH